MSSEKIQRMFDNSSPKVGALEDRKVTRKRISRVHYTEGELQVQLRGFY